VAGRGSSINRLTRPKASPFHPTSKTP
jgi:hypothetical protein